MSEIKHKITNLLNGIENDEIQYDELKSIRDYILQNTVSKEDVFYFLTFYISRILQKYYVTIIAMNGLLIFQSSLKSIISI